jgi:hypothetical protein
VFYAVLYWFISAAEPLIPMPETRRTDSNILFSQRYNTRLAAYLLMFRADIPYSLIPTRRNRASSTSWKSLCLLGGVSSA